MKVCIGNINRGSLSTAFVSGLLHAAQSGGAVTNWQYHCAGPYLDAARNTVVHGFLRDTDADWLLFIDSDIGFNGDQVDELVADVDPYVTPVVGGLYMNPTVDGHVKPVAYTEGTRTVTTYGGVTLEAVHFDQIDLPPPDAADMVVDAIGTGFMAIHRHLLEKMAERFDHPREWFACEVQDGTALGEDFAFCRRVRSMGYPIVLNPRVRVAHLKDILLTPDNFKERA